MTSPRYYILDDTGEPAPCSDLLTWARWMETGQRQIALDALDTVDVSTVFLGLDHALRGGPPILFETMVFDGEHDGDQWRYHTRAEAEDGHRRVLAWLRGDGERPDA